MMFYMEAFKKVGGASGEIEVMLNDRNEDGTPISFFQSIILRSQYVEYKLSHYVDKAAESLFGFVSVLPGAFSAFRWEAIKETPLEEFLKGQKLTDSKLDSYASCKEANMYLAEDRIMCLEIIVKKDERYILNYIPGCKALTDAPSTLRQLIKQRRRWINGSVFASYHVFWNMCRVTQRKGRCCRKLGFFILYIYMLINMLISFVIVGLYYSAFSIFVRSAFDYSKCQDPKKPANFLENLYLIFVCI